MLVTLRHLLPVRLRRPVQTWGLTITVYSLIYSLKEKNLAERQTQTGRGPPSA